MNHLRGSVYRAIVAGACLLSLSSGAHAAESIRVLLSADVLQLDIRSGNPLWVTDVKGRGQALRASTQVVAVEKGFLLNGVRRQTEQLTLHGGEQGLTLTFPRPTRKSKGAAVSSGDSGTEVSVSGLIHLVRRGKGFL
ncbi:MAG TPA: hypothetical protein VK901_07685, partial [Nitrospiraceae bacterium]|nr:hypothetical protein [Nitrospiraceae bacterium]